MNHSPSVSGRSQHQWRKEERWLEWLCVVGLSLAALLLFCSDLGNVPLLDGEEAILAQVAKEIVQSSTTLDFFSQRFSDLFNADFTLPKFITVLPDNHSWIFPTLWGEPYFGHSFLVPDLIAIAYRWGGIHEWTTRLPIALLVSLSVPLFYKASQELFRNRLTAVFASLVYLTLLSVVHWGRLGTANGAILFWNILLIHGVLRSRRNLRASLQVGLALTGLCLTQPLLALLLSVAVIGFWAWDTPRLLQSPTVGIGIFLGLIPALVWYSYQWQRYGNTFLKEILSPPEFIHQGQWLGLISFYGLKLLTYSLPWLIFTLYGGQIAWTSQHWSWAKFILVWGGSYCLLILLMPGYWEAALIPLYPILALTCAIALAKVRNFSPEKPYPKTWRLAMLGLAFIAILITLCLFLNFPLDLIAPKERPFALLILVFLSFTLIMTANLMDQHRSEFIPILFWGIYVSLLLLVNTPFWLGKFTENYPVKPVANLIQQTVPKNELIYTSFPKERSSLNFYSNHQVIPTPKKDLLNYWQENKSPYLLVDTLTLVELDQSSIKKLGESVSGLHLITKKSRRNERNRKT